MLCLAAPFLLGKPIGPLRALWEAAANDNVLDVARADARLFDGVLDRVPLHDCAVRVIEAAAKGLGEAGSCG